MLAFFIRISSFSSYPRRVSGSRSLSSSQGLLQMEATKVLKSAPKDFEIM